MPIPTTPPNKKKTSSTSKSGGIPTALPTTPVASSKGKEKSSNSGGLPTAPKQQGGGLPTAPPNNLGGGLPTAPADVADSLLENVDDDKLLNVYEDVLMTENVDYVPAPVTASEIVVDNNFEDNVSSDEVFVFDDETLSGADLAAGQELMDLIRSDDSSEVILNGPDACFIKKRGQRFHMPNVRFTSTESYHKAVNEFLLPYVDVAERIDNKTVLIEGQMDLPGKEGEPPMLARVHILAPPLVRNAKITIAKKARYDLDLTAISNTGALTHEMAEFLRAAVQGRLTMVVAGPTGAGKTTLLQALTGSFDVNDRVLVIEDTPELRLPLTDVVYLQSSTMRPGLNPNDIITTEWLVKAANRMRMDRIIVGECRGGEIAEWLIAANSGAEGSLTTVHADNPRRSLDKVLNLAMKSSTSNSEDTVRREIASTVDLIVQAGLIDGKHVITHIEEISSTVRNESKMISSQNIFEYDRNLKKHITRGRPSDGLINTLRSRGVAVNNAWFQ